MLFRSAVPNVINAGKMQGLMAYLNNSWLESSLETYLIGFEPLRQIAGQITGYWLEQTEERLVATLVGLRNYDQANGKKFTTEKSAVFSVQDFVAVEGTMASNIPWQRCIGNQPCCCHSIAFS